MSFNDVASKRVVRSSAGPSSLDKMNFAPGGDTMSRLSELLGSLQKNCMLIKERIVEMRRRPGKVNPYEKSELDASIRDVRDTQTRSKNLLDAELKSLEILPRTEIASKRLALAKLQKDFERIQTLIQTLGSESALIKVDPNASSSAGSRGGSSKGGTGAQYQQQSEYGGGRIDLDLPVGGGGHKEVAQQLIAVNEVDIDTLIVEERERDIKRLTTDIRLVNEMFKDMAEIVQKQDVMVQEVAKSTDEAHDKAKQGLEQVKQASEHQRACIVS